MGLTGSDTGHILHSAREFTGLSCGVLGPAFTKHDKLFPDVISYSRLPRGYNSDAVRTDSRTTW